MTSIRATDARRPSEPSAASFVDFDLHGLLRVRLVDPSEADVAAVSRELGTPRGTLPRDPDVTIRFVEEVSTSGAVRYVEPDEIAFTEDAFLILGPGRKPAAQIPLDDLGRSPELVCRSGLGSVPLLGPIVDLSMLGRGIAAVHASAFTYEGKGSMVAGWGGGAKTTSLLAFMSNGAQLIADDRVYLDPDGPRLYGLPQPVSIRARHLAEFPRYRELVGRRERARLGVVTRLGKVAASFGGGGKLAQRVAASADDAHTKVPPERLFGPCAFAGELETAFLSIPHESEEIRTEAVDPEWFVDRLAFVLRAERERLEARYLAFRFAFPERASELLESAVELERELVARALRETETYAFYHPSPSSAQALFPALAARLA